MDCLIKIVKGPGEGEEFHCAAVETVLGRSARSHVRLESPTVSFEHAVITRNGDEFFLENLSASGTFVNEERISGRVKLRAKDKLRLGQETVVRVEAVPAGSGDESRRKWLMAGVVAMIVVLMAVVVWDPMSGNSGTLNFKRAYEPLDAWVRDQTSAGRLPVELQDHLEKAWRLRMAGDFTDSGKEWQRAGILLATLEDKTGFQAASDANRRALSDLLKPPAQSATTLPQPTDDEMGAALVQFVKLMEPKK
jgi:predicted component of type VI protein secretion system